MIWFAGALALSVAAALSFLIARARAIKGRHLRMFGAGVPPLDPDAERLVDAPRALYHGTRFADGQRVLAPSLGEACVADLFCTGQALFLRREQAGPEGGKLIALPLAWVFDASLHRAHAPLAGKELPMLRVRWKRGGEELVSEVSLRGGMAQLERLRREIHLRQPEALERLRRFLEAQPVPGAGAGPDAPGTPR
ncbi:MAG TPA: hypothetical protein VN883_09200 [Myxococcales bacterium]|jgi:hypothetical protein|nr:hypothetical protein [Myxococcales bacterium]